MAQSDLIKSEDIIQKDLFKNTIQSSDELALSLIDTASALQLIQKESANFLKQNQNPKTAEELKKVNDKLKESVLARKGLQEVEKAQIKLDVEREKLKQAQIKTDNLVLKQLRDEEKEKEKLLKQQAKELENQKKSQSAYSQASKQLNELRQRYKDLAVEGKANTAEAIRYLVEITKLDRELKEIDASVGQFNRSVGDYSNQVQDAIEKTGFFGDIISKITQFVELFESVTEIQTTATQANTVATDLNTLALETNIALTEAEILAHEQNVAALQAETVATEKLSLAKRVLNAITSPVGLILLAVGAVIALTKAVYDVNQSLQDSLTIGKAFAQDKFWGTGTLFQDLAKETIKFRKEINGLNEELQILNDNEGDLSFVYQDQTITLNERKKALDEYNNARLQASQKGIEIAQRELDLANLTLKAEESRRGVGKGNALQEFYDKQSEAVQKLFDANDKYLDLIELEIPKAQREFKEQTIIDEIELIRSKKLGADSQVEILKKQVDDETTILQNRKESLKQLTEAQLNAQNTEIELLKEFGLTKTEIENLIAEQDAVKLARDLDELGRTKLSIAQKETLAKVVLESQKNALDRANQQAKIDEKEIENKKTLLKLQNEIEQINLDEAKRISNENLQDIAKNTENLKQKSLESDNVFNRKKQQLVLENYKKEREAQLQLLKDEESSIKHKYQMQVDAIKDKIKNEKIEQKIRQKEIEKINTQKIEELNQLAEKEKNIEQEKQKYLLDLRKKQNQAIINDLQQVTESLGTELNRRNDRQQKALDYELEKRSRNIEKQRDLAQRGLANQLAFEEQQQAKSELKKQQLEERNQRRQEILEFQKLYLSSYNARLAQPNADPNTAPFLALKDVFTAKGLAKSVQFFNEGTEYVKPKGQSSQGIGHDYIPAMLAEGEAVVNYEANTKFKGVTKSLNEGTFDKYYMPITQLREVTSNIQKGTAQNMYNSLLVQEQFKTNALLEDLLKKPTQQVHVDTFGNLVETIYQQTEKTIITHKMPKRKL